MKQAIYNIHFEPFNPDDLYIPPVRSTTQSAAVDIFNVTEEEIIVKRGSVVVVETNLKTIIPPGYALFLTPRSGLAQNGLTIVNSPGIVDSDYRGEIKIILTSFAQQIKIAPRARFAQAVGVHLIDGYTGTQTARGKLRGQGGFGSTGDM